MTRTAILAPIAAPAGSAPGSGIQSRRVFPVGARFPRLTLAAELTYLSAIVQATPPAPVFPVGARFPRRTAADVQAYLAAPKSVVVSTHGRIFPIGAKFPKAAQS